MLDLKFYLDAPLNKHIIHKVSALGQRFAHHMRLSVANDVDTEIFKILRRGFQQGLK